MGSLFYCWKLLFFRLSDESDLLKPSSTEFSLSKISKTGKTFFEIFNKFGLIRVERNGNNIKCNNFTLLNLVLILFGPCNEETLTIRLLTLQVISSKS